MECKWEDGMLVCVVEEVDETMENKKKVAEGESNIRISKTLPTGKNGKILAC